MNKIYKIIKDNVSLIIAVIIILGGMLVIASFEGNLPLGGRSGGDTGEMLTTTTSNLENAWTNHPVFSGSAILNKIGIGKTGGQVAVFDSITVGSTDSIVFFATASSAQIWNLDLKIDTGILVNTTDQDHAMFFYTPD